MTADSDHAGLPSRSDLSPAEETGPVSDRLRAVLLRNKIQNAEADLQFARRHSHAIFRESEQILQACEVVAFDLGLAEYILTRRGRDHLARFIDMCQRFRFDFHNAHDIPNAVSRALEHIRFVHTDIITGVSELQNCKWDKADFFSKDIEQLMERSSPPPEKPDGPPSTNSQPKTLSYSIKESQSASPPVTSSFSTKISELIRADSSDSTKASADARAWLGRVSFRLQVIDDLKKEVERLREQTPQPRQLAPNEYKGSAIRNSQFFSTVAGNAAFLRNAYSSVQRQERLLSPCRDAFRGAIAQLEELKKKADETRGRVTVNIGSLSDGAKRRAREASKLQNELTQVYQVLVPDEVNQKMLEGIQKVEEIDKEIEKMLAEDKRDGAEDASQILKELRESRNLMMDQCKEVAEARRTASIAARQLFSIVSEVTGRDEGQRLMTRESEAHSRYRDAIVELRGLIDRGLVDEWCRAMHGALQEAQSAMTSMKADVEEMQKIEETDYDQEMEALEKELDALQDEASALLLRKAEINSQKMHAKEALFSQFQNNMIYKKWMYSLASELREKEMQKLAERITCSVCKERYCNVCLKECGHPFCSECYDEIENHCPTCRTHLKDKSAVRFLYKPD